MKPTGTCTERTNRRGHPQDDSPLLRACYDRWNQRRMTWQEAVEEAALIMHLAVKLDAVRARDTQR